MADASIACCKKNKTFLKGVWFHSFSLFTKWDDKWYKAKRAAKRQEKGDSAQIHPMHSSRGATRKITHSSV